MPPTLFVPEIGANQFASLSIGLLLQFLHYLWQSFGYILDLANIPLPIGMIGMWRWSVWLLRRLIGLWYRPRQPNNFRASTAVITPVYNEEPDLFRSALRSWAANNPNEIIAVIDHTDTACMEQFRAFEAECAGRPIALQMLITHTPGKRPALADGILAATSEIVFLVDSDTIWDPDVLPKSLAPFTEAEVGGVTIRQRVLNPGSTAQRLFDVYLDIRYIDEIRFLTAFGDAVTCLSGRTAVYRRAVALTALEDLMEETFWGRQVISGDDKALTLAVQSRGWKVRYQGNTCVYTPGATEMKVFLKQRLRWARNSWRADLKALYSRWAWRKPLFAFHLCDRLLQPLTTLVAPLYLGYALWHQEWRAVGVLLVWWTVSRTIKIWPHLQRNWRNIRILPWYIFFNYWSAVMKIYAFFTMNQQGWITRWSRGGKADAWLKSLRAVPSYLATAATVSLVALFIQTLHEIPTHADGKQRAAEQTNSIGAPSLLTVAAALSATPVSSSTLSSALSTTAPLTEVMVALQPTLLQGHLSLLDHEPSVEMASSLAHPTTMSAPAGQSSSINQTILINDLLPDQSRSGQVPAAPASSQLCVLHGIADGACMDYRLTPTDSHAHRPATTWERLWQQVARWWPQHSQQRFTRAKAIAAPTSLPPTDGAPRSPSTLIPDLFCVTMDGEEVSCTRYDSLQ